MREPIFHFLSRPWVARITCGVLFVAIMAGLRVALVALRDSGDRTLAFSIGIPVIAGGIALAFWLERRGY